MSFDARSAFVDLDGKKFRGSDLFRLLKQIRSAHYRELPIEFTVDDLFGLMQQNRWVKEDNEGLLVVRLD